MIQTDLFISMDPKKGSFPIENVLIIKLLWSGLSRRATLTAATLQSSVIKEREGEGGREREKEKRACTEGCREGGYPTLDQGTLLLLLRVSPSHTVPSPG